MKNSTEPKEQNFVAENAELQTIVSRKEAKTKGLKYYFTGKECPKGHISIRLTSCWICCECHESKENKNRIETWRRKNKEHIKKTGSDRYYKDHKASKEKAKISRDKNKDTIKKWRKDNKNHVRKYNNKYKKERRKNPIFVEADKIAYKRYMKTRKGRAKRFMHQCIYRLIDSRYDYFCKREKVDMGYSSSQLVKHIESLWVEGMSWSNHTRDGWHIDHIKPISLFIKEGITDPKIVNALSNLQPLWAKDNMSKGAKYDDTANR